MYAGEVPIFNVELPVKLSEDGIISLTEQEIRDSETPVPIRFQVHAGSIESAREKLKLGFERMMRPGKDDGYPFK